MRRFVVVVAALAIAGGLAVQAEWQPGPGSQQSQPAKPDQKQDPKAVPSVAGKWTMTLDMSMGVANPALELKQDGEKLTGTYTGRYGVFALEGQLKGRAIAFSFTMTAEDQQVAMSFSGEVAADGLTMKGTATLGELGDATWSAKKEKAAGPNH